MFDKEYSFRGKHADMVNKLTSQFNSFGNKLFARNLDVYLLAPIIGFLYSRQSVPEKGDSTTKIFLEQLLNNQLYLWFNYRLIMLLDQENEKEFENRLNKAFRDYGKKSAKDDEELFEKYVLGGVEILSEKLIDNVKNEDDYLLNLYNFLEEFNERYNKDLDADSVIDLCRLARDEG
jgi:hypothetical protein